MTTQENKELPQEEWVKELTTLLNRKGIDHLPTEGIYEEIIAFIHKTREEAKEDGYKRGLAEETDIEQSAYVKALRLQVWNLTIEACVGIVDSTVVNTPDQVAKLNTHLPSTLQQATYSEAVGYEKATKDIRTSLVSLKK